jgi:hypothetical protein
MSVQKKNKSRKRFEQVNHLVDVVLPTSTNRVASLVLLVGWRHADVNNKFRKSAKELAVACGVTKRHIQRVLDEMLSEGVIEIVSKPLGSIPTTYRITGNRFNSRGDANVTQSKNARGDI